MNKLGMDLRNISITDESVMLLRKKLNSASQCETLNLAGNRISPVDLGLIYEKVFRKANPAIALFICYLILLQIVISFM